MVNHGADAPLKNTRRGGALLRPESLPLGERSRAEQSPAPTFFVFDPREKTPPILLSFIYYLLSFYNSISNSTGQWSLPITSIRMSAFSIFSTRRLLTRK